MNARSLSAWSVAALTIALVSTNPVYRFALVLIGVAVLLHLARPEARLRTLVAAVSIGCVVSVALEVVLGHSGADVIVRLPAALPVIGGVITSESLLYGIDIALGLAACAVGVGVLTQALEAHELIDALPSVLHRTATAVAAALNLVPGLARSAMAVSDAQRMRGWRPGGPRSWTEVLVPVVVTAMEDSLMLAEAMEARGYGAGRRTRYTTPRLTRADLAVLVTSLTAAVLIVAARITGLDADWSPYPSPALPDVQLLPLLSCLLLITPVLTWRSRASAG